MTPAELKAAGQRLYGRRNWAPRLAEAIGRDRTTIYNLLKRDEIPALYVVAVNALLDHSRRQRELEAAARRLMPRMKRERKKK